jgi:hypothetical protein
LTAVNKPCWEPFVVGGLSWEAIGRFSNPEHVPGKTVMIDAAIGIAVNGVCAWLFASGRKDLNVRGACAQGRIAECRAIEVLSHHEHCLHHHC